jgi:putative ubiquitin-RnfH superfamily antitoxin RatB of RatAB toxin-antitoxin module
MAGDIRVEVAYALPERQVIVRLRMPVVTALEAIQASGILEKHPEIDLRKNKIGVYGRLVSLDTLLRDQDRVEIYRSLIADPKEVRRKRAQEQRLTRKCGVPPGEPPS